MPLMAVDRDAPILDRLVTITLEYPGRYNDFGEFTSGRQHTMKVWSARARIDVDVTPTNAGARELGSAVYIIRWLGVAFTLAERDRSAKPAIVRLTDDVGSRIVTGVENWPGYRGRYLELRCGGTR